MVAFSVLLPVRLIDYGLRDYGTAKWEGGDPECEHTVGSGDNDNLKGYVTRPERDGEKRKYCQKCGAIRIDEQIGLEQTPDEYIANLVAVFRECKRILRDDGTLWVNIGDSYNGSAPNQSGQNGYNDGRENRDKRYSTGGVNGLKPKDLIGIPWMLAFALRADGWYLRQDIIWAKPNPMPESVKDRCTKSHEYIFLLSKSAKYYYDNEAVMEVATGFDGRKDTMFKGAVKSYDGVMPGGKPQSFAQNGHERWRYKSLETGRTGEVHSGYENPDGSLRVSFDDKGVPVRNKRDVWTVTTKPYKGAHYATFNPELIKPCILAGAPETCCAKCGAPYERIIERDRKARNELAKDDPRYRPNTYHGSYENINGKGDAGYTFTQTLGFEPTCDCNAGTSSGIVFDPFVGVERQSQRQSI